MFDSLKRKFKRTVKRITRRELSPEDLEDVTQELQIGLLESDVAVSVADQIMEEVKEKFSGKKLKLREDPKESVNKILREIIGDLLSPEKEVDVIDTVEKKKEDGGPAVLVFVGTNGCGKTTTVAKMAKYLQENSYSSVLAAADTFRAAGIEQLQKHGDRLGIRVIKHQRGADAAAVAYDAVKHAKAKDIDAVLVDTAGRMQTDVNLMEEMRKICRTTDPDLTIFVGDALTGNDALEQASKFDEAVGIDGSILCKMDADSRGGAALSIVKITGTPILFLGTGQDYDDLVEFDSDIILDAIFS